MRGMRRPRDGRMVLHQESSSARRKRVGSDAKSEIRLIQPASALHLRATAETGFHRSIQNVVTEILLRIQCLIAAAAPRPLT